MLQPYRGGVPKKIGEGDWRGHCSPIPRTEHTPSSPSPAPSAAASPPSRRRWRPSSRRRPPCPAKTAPSPPPSAAPTCRPAGRGWPLPGPAGPPAPGGSGAGSSSGWGSALCVARACPRHCGVPVQWGRAFQTRIVVPNYFITFFSAPDDTCCIFQKT